MWSSSHRRRPAPGLAKPTRARALPRCAHGVNNRARRPMTAHAMAAGLCPRELPSAVLFEMLDLASDLRFGERIGTVDVPGVEHHADAPTQHGEDGPEEPVH